LLADKAAIDSAKKAWASHIHLYTTEAVTEQGMFNHKALHYQHLVQNLWIRHVPGIIRLPGGGATVGGKWRYNTTGSVLTLGLPVPKRVRKEPWMSSTHRTIPAQKQ